MIKQIIICIVIVTAILFGNYITQNYTKEVVSEMSENLNSLRNKIMENNVKNDEDEEKIVKEAEKVNQNWEESHDKLAYYIEHNELEKIETELISIKSNIETKDLEQSIDSINKSIFLLRHVQDRYAFNLENIF